MASPGFNFIVQMGFDGGRLGRPSISVYWPFGSKAISRAKLKQSDLGTSPLGWIGNVVWFFLAGWWLFLYHLGLTILFGVTIIGIPFALQYWKLAKISLAPIGKTIVAKD